MSDTTTLDRALKTPELMERLSRVGLIYTKDNMRTCCCWRGRPVVDEVVEQFVIVAATMLVLERGWIIEEGLIHQRKIFFEYKKDSPESYLTALLDALEQPQ